MNKQFIELLQTTDGYKKLCIGLDKKDLYRLKCYIASNISTPQDILAELSKDKSVQVRTHVADNKSTPLDILVELSRDKNNTVRRYASNNLKSRTSR